MIAFTTLPLLAAAGYSLIYLLTTFVPFANIPHAGQPVHEEITRDAITNVMPAASPALIINLQRGVQNADIIHQFDSEGHFDNCSVVLNTGFSNGFATMNQRFAAARHNAMGNPEFLAPHYESFLGISTELVAALASLATDPAGLVQPTRTSRAAADVVLISSLLPSLAANPNPDTHRASNPRSLFHHSAAKRRSAHHLAGRRRFLARRRGGSKLFQPEHRDRDRRRPPARAQHPGGRGFLGRPERKPISRIHSRALPEFDRARIEQGQ